MVADVVSSLGGCELRIDDWHVDLAVAGPQKCLAGPPGMSLVAVSDRAWQALEQNPSAPRGSFLSLLDWKHRWIDGGRVAFPYTPSVADVRGVHAALTEALEDGIDATVHRHATAARAVRAGVQAMGLISVAQARGVRRQLRHRGAASSRDRDGGRARPCP